ncbi:unnamed protein product, partial [Polarella glacialis]
WEEGSEAMAGDGLWNVLPPGQRPIPLGLAARHLCRALEAMDRPPPGTAAVQQGAWQVLRLELPVAAAGPQVALLLDWLEAQSGLLPRALFAARDGSVMVAG